MQYLVIYICFSCLNLVIASAAIVLAWLRTKEEERSQKINELSVLVTCRSDTLAMLFSEVNSPVAHGST